MRTTLIVLTLVVIAGCENLHSTGQIVGDDNVVRRVTEEWLPSCERPLAEAPEAEREVRSITGLELDGPMFVRGVDLDADGRNDQIVTVSVESGTGARTYRRCHLTYVFKGSSPGAFGGQYKSAQLWFSLVTYDSNESVVYGDTQIRRYFRMKPHDGKWSVEVREFRYKSGPGDASDYVVKYEGMTSTTVPVADLSVGKIDSLLTLPTSLRQTGGVVAAEADTPGMEPVSRAQELWRSGSRLPERGPQPSPTDRST